MLIGPSFDCSTRKLICLLMCRENNENKSTQQLQAFRLPKIKIHGVVLCAVQAKLYDNSEGCFAKYCRNLHFFKIRSYV